MARVSFTLRSTEADKGSYLGGPIPIPPPPDLLTNDAIAWWDAAFSPVEYAPNLGTAGSALDAYHGASAGALLTHDGNNYVYLPGFADNYLSVDDADVPDITLSLEFVAQVIPDSWNTGSRQTFLAKASGSTDFGYAFYIDTSGYLALDLSPDGTTGSVVTATSTALPSFTAGEMAWVKVTWVASLGTVAFYTSTDGYTWVALGTSISSILDDTTVFDSTTDLNIGAMDNGTLYPFGGQVHQIIIRQEIGSVADFDFDTDFDVVHATDLTMTSTSGVTVTVHRKTSGLGTALVVRPVWIFNGTSDYMSVADNDLLDFDPTTDQFTVLWVGRIWDTPGSWGRLVDKRVTSSGAGYALQTVGTEIRFATYFSDGTDGKNTTHSVANTSGELLTIGTGYDTAFFTTVNGLRVEQTLGNVDSLANGNDFVIGKHSSDATSYQRFELMGVAVFDHALAADELESLYNYYSLTEGPGRVDFDYMLRADNLILAPEGEFDGVIDFGEPGWVTGPGGSVGGGGTAEDLANRTGSYFAAGSHCYEEVRLEWGVDGLPRTATSPPLGLTPVPTETVLVYSDQGEPQTLASGDILAEGDDVFFYQHDGLPAGRWAYYTLFVRLQAVDGTDFYEKGASIAVLVPTNYGSTVQLWKRIPAFYRAQDTALGSTENTECVGLAEQDVKVGPLLRYLSIVGFDMDRMRTILDYTMASRDPDVSHTEVLDALAEQMGVIMRSTDLGPARLRRLMGEIGQYRRTKGTVDAMEFLGQAIAGGNVEVDRLTGDIKVYSQRVNYITDPKDGTGLIDHRPAGNEEVDTPSDFSDTTYAAYTDEYNVVGTSFIPTLDTAASPGVAECVMIRVLSDVYVLDGERLCFSVHSNLGTEAIKWARVYSDDIELRDANGEILTFGVSLGTDVLTDDGATNNLTDDAGTNELIDESYFVEEALTAPATAGVSGFSDIALLADGAKAFEISINAPTADGTFYRCGVEFLIDLRELTGEDGAAAKFRLENMLLEKNYLGSYFDGDTKRGGWLVDTNSISDYRWAGTPYESHSIYAEEYVRTNGILDSLLIDYAVPITESPYFTITKYNAVHGVD